MRRRYNRLLIKEKVNYIKSLMPNACIGADVIVGFPGETDEFFLETYKFIQSLNLSYLHVFTYSERENTKANKFSNVVSKQIRSKRSKILRSFSVKMRRDFYLRQLGTQKNILFESQNKKGFIYGFTENYVRVKTPWRKNLVDKIVKYKLKEISEDGFVLAENAESLAIV